MAKVPRYAEGGGLTPHMPGFRRGGCGRAPLRKIAVGFLRSSGLVPVPLVIPNAPATVTLPDVLSPGFTSMRLHINVTTMAPGGQLQLQLQKIDPTTGVPEPASTAFLIADTGALGVGTFDIAANAHQLGGAIGPAAWGLWHWQLIATDILAGGVTTLNGLKIWLSRTF